MGVIDSQKLSGLCVTTLPLVYGYEVENLFVAQAMECKTEANGHALQSEVVDPRSVSLTRKIRIK